MEFVCETILLGTNLVLSSTFLLSVTRVPVKDVKRELLVVLEKAEKLILKLKEIRNVGYFCKALQAVISLYDVYGRVISFWGEKVPRK